MKTELKSFQLAAALTLGLAGAVLILWKVPQWQVSFLPETVEAKVRFDAEDAARKTVAQILAGATLLLGLYFTARTYRLNYEGQITDRFSKAVEQLGDDKMAVRLGGIYALERIAKDSRKDHWTIIEVFAAYVRANSPWREDTAPCTEPATDIQAVLTIIGRINNWSPSQDTYIDLIGTDIRRAYLANANLQGVNFADAHLEGADLRFSNLGNADLRGAFLGPAVEGWDGTNLYGAQLRNADLNKADITKAILEHADLTGAAVRETDLSRASLTGAKGLREK